MNLHELPICTNEGDRRQQAALNYLIYNISVPSYHFTEVSNFIYLLVLYYVVVKFQIPIVLDTFY